MWLAMRWEWMEKGQSELYHVMKGWKGDPRLGQQSRGKDVGRGGGKERGTQVPVARGKFGAKLSP